MIDTSVTVNGIPFKNPILTASGTFGFGREFSEIYDISALGGIVSKGLTLNPKNGNLGTRIQEVTGGLMNSIGMQNPGVPAFIETELPFMKSLGTVVIANLGGGTEEEYLKGAELLNATDVDIVELNISCPNVKAGGMAFGIESATAHDIVSKVRKVLDKKPLWVKLSPNARNIPEMAKACEAAGADALSLINTVQAMAIDLKKRKPVFDNVFAGLSGPCVKPIALRMVHEAAGAVKVPIVGLGGIATAEDALEFLLAGASLVQLGASQFRDPYAAYKAATEFAACLEENGFASAAEAINYIHKNK